MSLTQFWLTGACFTAFWTWHYETERQRHRMTRTRHFDFRGVNRVLALLQAFVVGLAWPVALPSTLLTHLFTEPHG